MGSRYGTYGYALGLSALAMATAATAQTVPQAQRAQPLPSRDELRAITGTPEAPRPRLEISGGIERSPCAFDDEQYADLTVTINEVEFGGLEGVTGSDLAPAWQPFAGQEVPISALCEIRDAAATILRNEGYLAAAQLPTQRIENGKVRFELLYARIVAIRARGQTQGAEAKLQEYLGNLTEGEIFDRDDAERYLLLARDLPGYDVQLRLKPADGEVGDLIGEVTVLRKPYAADLTIQNYGADATGPWGGQVRGQVFGITGLGDATSLSYYATADFSEQHIVQLAHEFRPGSEGLVVNAQATYAWTNPDLGTSAGAADVDLDVETLFASASAAYPIKRSRGENFWISSGFDFVNQDVELIVPLARDRIRVGWLKADYDSIDTSRRAPLYRFNASFEVRQGLKIFDASEACIGPGCPQGFVNPGRVDGEADATVFRSEFQGELSLSRMVALGLSGRGQAATGGLLGFEEFTAGNYTSGRGYEPGVLAGDHGIGLSAELRTSNFSLDKGGRVAVQPYAFFDLAKVWNEDDVSSPSLASTGAGVRAQIDNRFTVGALLAVPLKRAGFLTETPDPRLLITLTARL